MDEGETPLAAAVREVLSEELDVSNLSNAGIRAVSNALASAPVVVGDLVNPRTQDVHHVHVFVVEAPSDADFLLSEAEMLEAVDAKWRPVAEVLHALANRAGYQQAVRQAYQAHLRQVDATRLLPSWQAQASQLSDVQLSALCTAAGAVETGLLRRGAVTERRPPVATVCAVSKARWRTLERRRARRLSGRSWQGKSQPCKPSHGQEPPPVTYERRRPPAYPSPPPPSSKPTAEQRQRTLPMCVCLPRL